MHKHNHIGININCLNIRKKLLKTKIKSIIKGGARMNKYFLQNDLNSKFIDKFNFDSSASESLIEKIKNIENFSFEVDGIEIQENNEDCDVKINIEKAFSEDEIKEYKLLKDKFSGPKKTTLLINLGERCMKYHFII